MPLKTDYTNDILDTSKNVERHYVVKDASGNIIIDHGTIEDVTEYEQEGSRFGANDINEAFTKINKLTAQDGLEFDLQVDADGNYGMLDLNGEFLSFGGQSMQLYTDLISLKVLKGQTNGVGRKYTFNKKCTVTAIAYGVGSSSSKTELTVTGGTLIADHLNVNTGTGNYSTSANSKTYEMNVGGTLTIKASGYAGYNDEYEIICMTSTSNDYSVTSVTV